MRNFIGAKSKSLGHQWDDPSIIGAPTKQTRISLGQGEILSDFNEVNHNFIWITPKSMGLDFHNVKIHWDKTLIIGAPMRQTRISMDQDGILSDFNEVNHNFIWITPK